MKQLGLTIVCRVGIAVGVFLVAAGAIGVMQQHHAFDLIHDAVTLPPSANAQAEKVLERCTKVVDDGLTIPGHAVLQRTDGSLFYTADVTTAFEQAAHDFPHMFPGTRAVDHHLRLINFCL